MKTPSKNKIVVLTILASILAVSATAAAAQLSKTQSQSYTLSPTETSTIQNIALGTLQGGSTGSQTFNDVVSFDLTQSGTRTVTATLDVNDTSFASYEVAIFNSAGQVCDLKGGSAVSQTLTCSWTLTGPSDTAYSETVIYTASDGISYSGVNTLAFTIS